MVIVNREYFFPEYAPTHSELVERMHKWVIETKGYVAAIAERAGGSGGEIPDVLAWTTNGESILIECKASRSDFLADSKKDFRQNPEKGLGQIRYFAAPKKMLNPDELPDNWGLLEVSDRQVRTVKKAIPIAQTEIAIRSEVGFMARILRDTRVMVAVLKPKQQLTEGGE